MTAPDAFRIELEGGAERDLERLPPHARSAVLQEIRGRLSADPFRELKTRVRRLSGFVSPLYRLRVGDYRAYYRVLSARVVVLGILHKKDSERWLRRL